MAHHAEQHRSCACFALLVGVRMVVACRLGKADMSVMACQDSWALSTSDAEAQTIDEETLLPAHEHTTGAWYLRRPNEE